MRRERTRNPDKCGFQIGDTCSRVRDLLLARGRFAGAPPLNVVCLTGRLVDVPDARIPLSQGWSNRLLKVPRRGLWGGEEPGAFDVNIVLPPELASKATRGAAEHGIVAVVGMLSVDIDYSAGRPHIQYAVVAESIERLGSLD